MKRRLLDGVGDTDNEPTNAAKKNKLGFIFAKEPVFSDEEEEAPGLAGLIYVLGQGDCGQLGKGEDFMEAKLPSLSPLPENIKAKDVAAGGVHSLAIDFQARVYSSGVNDEGALGRRTDNKIWETEEAKALQTPGISDDFEWGTVPLPLSNGLPIAVSAGDSHSAVLTDCGTVWGWGTYRDSGGVYGFQPDCKVALLPKIVCKPANWARVIQICSGTDHMLALLESGKVLSWGTGWQGQLGRIGKATFHEFTVAKHAYKRLQSEAEILEDKLKEAEGLQQASLERELNSVQANLETASQKHKPLEKSLRQKQLNPAEVNIPARIVSISCGWYNSFAVDDKGKVWSFGLDNYGQSSAAEPVSQSKAGEEEERYIYEPQKVASLEAHDIVRVAGGNQHTLALTKSGKVLSFGRTTYGRLGRLNEDFESNVAQEEPRAVDGLFQVHANSISAGEEVSACISENGKAFLWGSGTNKQLGNTGKSSGLRNAGLEQGEKSTKAEDGDLDEIIPLRLDASSFSKRRVHKIEFGGQHALILAEEQ